MSSSSPDLAPAFCRQAYLRPCRPGKGRGAPGAFAPPQAAKEPTRRRRGKGWSYLHPDGRVIRDRALIDRLTRLAVPPAYEEVLYATDERAHLQAIGRDAAGRLQYRYHPEWEKVREVRKARRLARLADVLP